MAKKQKKQIIDIQTIVNSIKIRLKEDKNAEASCPYCDWTGKVLARHLHHCSNKPRDFDLENGMDTEVYQNPKRIPLNSVGLIFNFNSGKDRSEFINHEDYFALTGALFSLAKEFVNKGIEIVFNP